MKMIAFAAAGFLAVTSPVLASEGPACLQSQLIEHTHTVNTRTVLFYMRGGKIWQNDLPQACNGLKLHGFVVHGQDSEICGGQGIKLIESGDVCVLGKFSAYWAHSAGPAH